MPGSRALPDFDAEARKLFAKLNLSPTGAASETSASGFHRYRDLDPVWQHPSSGACVFIGNQTAASAREILRANCITHVVNCTSDMPLYFKGKDPSISYFRFDIYRFYKELNLRSHRGVLEFFTPVFRWIDAAVAAGNGVLIHCLAGAHRAGTTGVAYTMHAANLDHKTAITACQACRPVVDPIEELTEILAQLEIARSVASCGCPVVAAGLSAEGPVCEELMSTHIELLEEKKRFLEEEVAQMAVHMKSANVLQGKPSGPTIDYDEVLGILDRRQKRMVDDAESLIEKAVGPAGAMSFADDETSTEITDVDVRLARHFAALRGLGAAGQHQLLEHLRQMGS